MEVNKVVSSICLIDKYILQFEEIHFTIWRNTLYNLEGNKRLSRQLWAAFVCLLLGIPTHDSQALSTRGFIFLQIAHFDIFQKVQIFLLTRFDIWHLFLHWQLKAYLCCGGASGTLEFGHKEWLLRPFRNIISKVTKGQKDRMLNWDKGTKG